MVAELKNLDATPRLLDPDDLVETIKAQAFRRWRGSKIGGLNQVYCPRNYKRISIAKSAGLPVVRHLCYRRRQPGRVIRELPD